LARRARAGGHRARPGHGPGQQFPPVDHPVPRSRSGAARQPKRRARPNVIVIINDDMRASDWRALPKTLRELKDHAWYTHFMSALPVCTPSRVSMLTGMYAHNHAVLENVGETNAGYAAFRRNGLEERSLPVVLQKAGYYTGLVGKFMHGYDMTTPQPKGWDRWVARASGGYVGFDLVVDGKNIRFARHQYVTDVLAGYARDFLDTAPEQQPFFLLFAPTAPHGPYVPSPRYKDRYPDAVVGRDGSFNEADVSDKPAHIASQPPLTPEQIAQIDADERLRLQMLSSTDEAIVSLIKDLQKSGRLDNTCIFIMSDNGAIMGQHRLPSSKGLPYDQAVRVPMLAWGRSFKARTLQRLTSHADIAPTIADLAGTVMPAADGRSLLQRVRRDFIPLQVNPTVIAAGGHGLRSQALMYFEYASGEREYYDHRADPFELTNLLATAGPPPPPIALDLPTPAALSARLAQVKTCKGASCP
ncbi:MAG: sulfatase, partial [Chloroflexota bacterium]